MKNAKIHAITNMVIEINLKGVYKAHYSLTTQNEIIFFIGENCFYAGVNDYKKQEDLINELKKYL